MLLGANCSLILYLPYIMDYHTSATTSPCSLAQGTLLHALSSSSPGRNTPLKQPLASYLGCTFLVPQLCRCSPCRAHFACVLLDHKSASKPTMAPSARQGRAGPRMAGCLLAASLRRKNRMGILPCPDTQRFSWTSQHHSSWNTRTTHPGPSRLPQMA